jgi:hypothetical protein
MAVLTTLSLLAVALVSWVARVPVSARAELAHPGMIWIALEAALTGVFLLGLEGAVIGMLPLRFVRGRDVWEWNRWIWAGVTFVCITVFVHILFTPNTGGVFSNAATSTVKLILLFVIFGALSVGFWAWFRFRPDPEGYAMPSREGGVEDEGPGSTDDARMGALPWSPPPHVD